MTTRTPLWRKVLLPPGTRLRRWSLGCLAAHALYMVAAGLISDAFSLSWTRGRRGVDLPLERLHGGLDAREVGRSRRNQEAGDGIMNAGEKQVFLEREVPGKLRASPTPSRPVRCMSQVRPGLLRTSPVTALGAEQP